MHFISAFTKSAFLLRKGLSITNIQTMQNANRTYNVQMYIKTKDEDLLGKMSRISNKK